MIACDIPLLKVYICIPSGNLKTRNNVPFPELVASNDPHWLIDSVVTWDLCAFSLSIGYKNFTSYNETIPSPD